jgi:hypothetical protein
MPASTTPASCEDGSAPSTAGDGSLACDDGSEPVCDDGSTPVRPAGRATLLCPPPSGSGVGVPEQGCEGECSSAPDCEAPAAATACEASTDSEPED